eukprot:351465-Chlamydomonas_euryale.AAC.11
MPRTAHARHIDHAKNTFGAELWSAAGAVTLCSACLSAWAAAWQSWLKPETVWRMLVRMDSHAARVSASAGTF